MGDVSDTRKQILQNTLTDELKKYFRIVPQEKYEQVLEQVFEELECEECSEDTYIMRVQEMLQVENVFNLQIIGEGKDSQLNLKWITLYEKKNETDYCEGCNTKILNDKVKGLVEKLVGEKKPEVVVEKKGKGILYKSYRNGKWGWFKSGDEKEDNKYEGEVENGEPNGQGIITFSDGWGKYVGEWKDGKENGQGTFTLPNGGKLEGEWKDGKFHGQGTETYPNGDKYVGEFKDGLKNGQGITTYSSGGKYVGEFKDSLMNGQGTETFPDGQMYVGEWKDGLKNGQGTFTFPSGSKYVGDFKDGKPNGQGTETFPSGDKYVGEYKDGKMWNGKYYFKSGRIDTQVNGEWIEG